MNAAQVRNTQSNAGYKRRKVLVRLIFTVLIGALALTMIVPFLWMISASLKRPLDVMKLPIQWIPDYW